MKVSQGGFLLSAVMENLFQASCRASGRLRHSWTRRWHSPSGFTWPSLCVCDGGQIFPFYKSTRNTQWGPTLMTSFKLDYLFSDTVSKQGHLLRPIGLRTSTYLSVRGGTIQPVTRTNQELRSPFELNPGLPSPCSSLSYSQESLRFQHRLWGPEMPGSIYKVAHNMLIFSKTNEPFKTQLTENILPFGY